MQSTAICKDPTQNGCKKSFRMKLTAVVMLICCLHVSVRAVSQTITYSGKNVKLQQVFTAIEQQTGYTVAGDYGLLQKAPALNIEARNEPLQSFLDRILKKTNIGYTIIRKTIFISNKKATSPVIDDGKDHPSSATPKFPVQLTVSGADGKPLEGASISVKGSMFSGITNARGMINIDVNEGDLLVISFVGYENRSIAITTSMLSQGNNLTITLQPSIRKLEEVEVTMNTGYQSISKERAAGSFSKPDMDVFRHRSGTMDIVSRLDGLVPGLTVIPGPKGVTTSSRFGSGNGMQQAIIRGKSSVAIASDPLYVVNGLPLEDISQINPEDIEDITVLKDAVASAIWGSRAANGVIVINTKSGRKNSPVRVSYSGFINFIGRPDFEYGKMLNSREYIQVAKETFAPVQFPLFTLAYGFTAPHESILYNQHNNVISADQANKSLDSLASINNMAQIKDLWYRNALTTSHTLSLTGGGNAYSFYGSVSYTDQQSNRPNDKNQLFRVNLNQEFNLGKRLKVSLNTSLADNIKSAGRNISIENRFLPYQLFIDGNGNSLDMNYVQGLSPDVRADYQARSRINLDYNPMAEKGYGHSQSNNLTMNVTGEVNVKLLKGLNFLGTYGYQKAPGVTKSYIDSKSYDLRSELLSFTVAPTVNVAPVYYLPTTGGTYTVNNYDQRSWTSRNQLVYNITPRGGRDALNVQVGQEAREFLNTGAAAIVRGYDENLQTYSPIDYNLLNNGILGTVSSFRSVLSERQFTELEERTRFNSYFGLASYALDGKYILSGSWRRDHSNLIGSDKSTQNRPIWSIGGKWNFSKEAFAKKWNWLNNGALRVTYGITGNSPFAGGADLNDILSIERGLSIPTAGTGVTINSPANRKLSWENTRTVNFGLDFAVLQSRLSGSVDYYLKKTTDLLGSVPRNPFTGFSSSLGNIGDLRNRGIEVMLRSSNIRLKDFDWITTITFSYNKNKLLKYSPVISYLNTAQGKVLSGYYAGYSMGALFAYRYAGLDKDGDPTIYLAGGGSSKDPNIAKTEDVIYKGTIIPVYNGGLGNGFRYKQFNLQVNMIYSLGNVMRKDINTVYNGRITGQPGNFTGNVNSYFLKRWQKPGDEKTTDIPRYIAGEFPFFSSRRLDYYLYGDVNVVSASYLKLRDITLSYALPATLLRRVNMTGASFYVQAANFMVWKANHADIDPEYQDFTTGNRSIPPFRHTYSIGTTISF